MKKASWLHWIGNEHKNTVEFLAEGRRQGIRLPVTLSELAAMSWNDDIYGLSTQERAKRGSVFCAIPVTRLSGLTVEAWEALGENFTSVLTDPGRFVEDTDRSFLIGAACKIMANMQDIAVVLEAETKRGVNIGKLMIGCHATDLVTLAPPWCILADVVKEKCLRQFSAARFLADIAKAKTGARFEKKLYGQYEAAVKVSGEYPGSVEWIDYYQEIDFDTTLKQAEFNFV